MGPLPTARSTASVEVTAREHRDTNASLATILQHRLALQLLRERFESGVHMDSDIAHALGIFERLRKVQNVTESLLRDTEIGIELNRSAWRNHRSPCVARESTSLVHRWRESVKAERIARVPDTAKT